MSAKYIAQPLFGKPSESDPRWVIKSPEGKMIALTVGGDDERNAKLIADALNQMTKGTTRKVKRES